MAGYQCIICKATNNDRTSMEIHIKHTHKTDAVDRFIAGGPMNPSAKTQTLAEALEQQTYDMWVCHVCGARFGPDGAQAGSMHVSRTKHAGSYSHSQGVFSTGDYNPELHVPPYGALIETGESFAVYVKDPKNNIVIGWLMEDGTMISTRSETKWIALNREWDRQGRNFVPSEVAADVVNHVGSEPPIKVSKRGDTWLNPITGTISVADADGTWKPIGTVKKGTTVELR